MERGIINKPPFDTYIVTHGWQNFTHSPGEANVTLATEFLANLRFQEKEGHVLCRGTLVPFSATVINDYFNLPHDPSMYEAYKKLKGELHWVDDERIGDWDGVVRQITRPNVPLDDILKREKWCNIDKKHLTTEMNVWYTFIAARLHPVTINSEVQWERIRLLYAIKKGIRVNVGALIYCAIQNSLTTSSGIGFHSLITSLCHRAGCEDRAEDTWKSPMALLTIEAFQRRVKQVQETPTVLPLSPDQAIRQPSSELVIMAKLDRMERFVRQFCEHAAKVIAYDKPEAIAALGNFPSFPVEDDSHPETMDTDDIREAPKQAISHGENGKEAVV